MKIVCSGRPYCDMDVYGGVIGYAELLRARAMDARAVITTVYTGSVPQMVREWPVKLDRTYAGSPDDTFSIIDTSDAAHFEEFVDLERVETVIDHHVGHETYWHDRLGPAAKIEFIGAACTLVYEEWQHAGLLGSMTDTTAKLLACGILDNTLNFSAGVTSDRDHAAYEKLAEIAHVDGSFAGSYFKACEEDIANDAVAAVTNDSKFLDLKSIGPHVLVGQVAVWDGKALLRNYKEKLEDDFSAQQRDWFINLISIGEKRSYYLATNSRIQKALGQLLGLRFDDNLAVSPRVWLRKEIIKRDAETV